MFFLTIGLLAMCFFIVSNCRIGTESANTVADQTVKDTEVEKIDVPAESATSGYVLSEFLQQNSGSRDYNFGAREMISDLGVIAGDSESIMPPAGWGKIPVDLNMGAGGKKIYLCYKSTRASFRLCDKSEK